MSKSSPKSELQKRREALLMSRADLAHKSGISIQTIMRIEEGKPCRMSTRKKLLLALGLTVHDDEWMFRENVHKEAS
ncbi:MAG: helix-turn-helix domain-containing protein [Deltaproteobacteria bacterium]|nr:MAG: helix-turn-helix domain-containing protein [Deltaproteobacteria bacterium]